ncbi:hypothetical protein GCM10010168_81530 [Actinoplanes ianthinogenes]|uniref:Uncharacterized protein n=1 Tax=Actinoplanes ianthinogenes TaxID=122358 RepID=A0ABN6C613_9ACTN|nr:hypothetical protein Aiant_11700 [Actinoplanes ianthinogenes]GGR50405.1 hypothetical protein GCM10010168_81530 [Actinoplanes ianthinogenes]
MNGGPPGDGADRTRSDIQNEIADILVRSHAFETVPDRERLLHAVSERYHGIPPVEPVHHAMTHLRLIVRTCAGVDCLALLVEQARTRLDGPATLRLLQLADEWDGVQNFSDDEWRTIRDIFQQLDIARVSNINELFRRAVRSRLPAPPAHCRSPWHIFVHLAGLNADDQGVPLFMVFLWQVADAVEDAVGRPLKRLVNQLGQKWGITAALQRRLWAPPLAEAGPAQSMLLILIDHHPLHELRYTVTYWYQWDPDRWAPHRGADQVVERPMLESAVRAIVETVESQWPLDGGPLRLEFVLPMTLLNLPVERWSKEIDPDDGPVPFYRHYPVVVRSLDRIQERTRHRVWRRRWQVLRDTPGATVCLYSTGDPPRLEQDIVLDERVVTLVLSASPEQPNGAREIRVAIRTGVPVLLWHRGGAPDQRFQQAVEDLLAYGGIVELPDRAQRLRITSSRDDDDLADTGRNLVLLWDDPSRLPDELGPPAPAGGISP